MLIVALALSLTGVAQERILVADGTRSQIGNFYLLESEMKTVRSALEIPTFSLSAAPAVKTPCGATEIEIKDVADGRFAGRPGRAVLYWLCEKKSDRLLSGILVLARKTIVSNVVFDFGSETKMAAVRDIDGNGSD